MPSVFVFLSDEECLRKWCSSIPAAALVRYLSGGAGKGENYSLLLEALMVSKPIIQFERSDFLNYDPLFAFKDFKWQFRKDAPQKALREILEMTDERYADRKQPGRRYIEKYFHPVTPESLSYFLPSVDC